MLRDQSSDTLLPELIRERILLLDGAMGTMIQRLKLEEVDVRGDRFADHDKDLKNFLRHPLPNPPGENHWHSRRLLPSWQ